MSLFLNASNAGNSAKIQPSTALETQDQTRSQKVETVREIGSQTFDNQTTNNIPISATGLENSKQLDTRPAKKSQTSELHEDLIRYACAGDKKMMLDTLDLAVSLNPKNERCLIQDAIDAIEEKIKEIPSENKELPQPLVETREKLEQKLTDLDERILAKEAPVQNDHLDLTDPSSGMLDSTTAKVLVIGILLLFGVGGLLFYAGLAGQQAAPLPSQNGLIPAGAQSAMCANPMIPLPVILRAEGSFAAQCYANVEQAEQQSVTEASSEELTSIVHPHTVDEEDNLVSALVLDSITNFSAEKIQTFVSTLGVDFVRNLSPAQLGDLLSNVEGVQTLVSALGADFVRSLTPEQLALMAQNAERTQALVSTLGVDFVRNLSPAQLGDLLSNVEGVQTLVSALGADFVKRLTLEQLEVAIWCPAEIKILASMVEVDVITSLTPDQILLISWNAKEIQILASSIGVDFIKSLTPEQLEVVAWNHKEISILASAVGIDFIKNQSLEQLKIWIKLAPGLEALQEEGISFEALQQQPSERLQFLAAYAPRLQDLKQIGVSLKFLQQEMSPEILQHWTAKAKDVVQLVKHGMDIEFFKQLTVTDWQRFLKSQLLFPRDTSLDQGDQVVEESKIIFDKLQEQHKQPNINFQESLLVPFDQAGTCSSMALDFIARMITECTKALSLEDCVTEKKDYYKHNTRHFSSKQAAYNTIEIVGENKQGNNASITAQKMQALASWHDMTLTPVTPLLSKEDNHLAKVFHRLPEGVYVIRLLKFKDNHKQEDYGHTMGFIKAEGRTVFYNNAIGAHVIYSPLPFLNEIFSYSLPTIRIYQASCPASGCSHLADKS
jgi:hypothetical protein